MISSAQSSFAGAYRALSLEDLRRLAPSIFAEHARPGVSARYTFVSTFQVVELLQAEGWEPVKANEQCVRVDARRGFQLHEIRFARRYDLETAAVSVGDTRPELVLQNAHDGTRAYRIDAGLYRLVCRNGLVVADAQFAQVSIRHFDGTPEKFANAARSIVEFTPRVLELVAHWQTVKLTPAARFEFARRAAALRWDADQPVMKWLTPAKLLEPVRYGDHHDDLWTVTNVVQEHLLRGGDRYRSAEPSFGIRRNTTRPVTSLHDARAEQSSLVSRGGIREQLSRTGERRKPPLPFSW
ncbi:MAG TPA: DUF932 domain-containing protein [Opitutaceae bacterium]|nr:DUF932 domain-containing protein [Opitutaceae bacterium]